MLGFITSILALACSLSPVNALTGEMVANQIVAQLKKQNLYSDPAIEASRQFPTCTENLTVESIFGSWRTVRITCPNTTWKLTVRTNIDSNHSSPTEHAEKSYVTQKFVISLNTNLNKGEVVKSIHLTPVASNKNIGGGVFYSQKQLIGRTLKRPLLIGTIIRARHLEPDWVISKDQIVTIEHQIGNILINAQGVAQESGQIGQRIWVNNFNSGKKVLCWIKDDKKVSTNAKVY